MDNTVIRYNTYTSNAGRRKRAKRGRPEEHALAIEIGDVTKSGLEIPDTACNWLRKYPFFSLRKSVPKIDSFIR